MYGIAVSCLSRSPERMAVSEDPLQYIPLSLRINNGIPPVAEIRPIRKKSMKELWKEIDQAARESFVMGRMSR